jgi:hypothetical protein
MNVKNELQNIVSGDATVKFGENIQAIIEYLRREKKTISGIEKAKFFKEQETKFLIQYVNNNSFWFNSLDESKYIGEGAEQKVFEFEDTFFVIKLNDSIFFESWEDYLVSLLLHNFFFPQLAYELLGFSMYENRFTSVVKQRYTKSNEPTNLIHVKDFLEANGFVNKKNNDYLHPDLGIILEDLHDENVLTIDGSLQFIDTIFYLTPSFYEN